MASASTSKGPIPLKIVIVGDGGVGKSSITMALLRRDFSEEYDPTVEDSYSTQLSLDGQDYSIELIDTAGQEEYRGLWAETSAREGDGFVVTYAIDSQDSFELLPDFLHTLRKAKSPLDNPPSTLSPENTPFPFIVIGNKCDKPPAERKVMAQQGLGLARSAGGLFYEVSAKQRVNIDSFFETLVRAVAKSKLLHQEHISRCRGRMDDGLFNGNVAFIEQQQSQPSASTRGVRYGKDTEKASRGGTGTRNPSLAMDRRRSLSVGGLGRDPDELGKHNDSHSKSCGCIIV
ncbi:Ras family protein [Sporobolomyces salmoneus]|uniref:Ras family protein n=1 Tax=Sporobolomyces salmoneus TaxID=183962 RepID=UPI00316CC103